MEIEKRYETLFDKMVSSKDSDRMSVFGKAEHWAFKKMLEISPKHAQMWLDKLEASEWNNYLSIAEADKIVADLQNQNGSKGPKWSFSQFESVVNAIGGNMEMQPYYNKYALWATANMIFSDHARTLSEIVSEADMPKIIYKLAVEQLKDSDRPRFIREYFKV